MHEAKLSALDLNLLVALDALLTTGSVSGAARSLHRSQPATSRMLAKLREMIGDPLLVSQGRGLVATGRARALKGPVKLLLSDARRLLEPPAPFAPQSDAAHFRLVTSDYAQVALLGPAVRWIEQAAPRVSLEVLPLVGDPIDSLATGRADLLFGPEGLCPAWCQSVRLLADAWACVRRRGEPMPTTIRRYLALDHVEVTTAAGFGDSIARALGPARRRRVRLTVPDFAGACFVVASSALIATLPEPVATAAAAMLQLAVGRPPFRIEAPGIAMIWPRRLHEDPAHAWLRHAVVESVKRSSALRRSRAARGPGRTTSAP